MKGDLTRSTFKREKHYSSVRMQQGRVQVDADWNEQADIQAYLRNRAVGDVIGHSGIPLKGGGFEIRPTPDYKDLIISPGRMYVDGVLCELEEAGPDKMPAKSPKKKKLTPGLTDKIFDGGRWAEVREFADGPAAVPVTTYRHQPYLPAGATDLDTAKAYLVYLDVWQRHVTSVDDPSIREVALGGPDTATRMQTVWQVKILELDEAVIPDDLCVPCDLQAYKDLIAPLDARMEAFVGEKDTDEECALVSRGGYRGLENHLYRVEIHDASGGKGKATFKWSRDNGSIVRSVEKFETATNMITLRVSGQDIPPAFAGGKWVEVTDEKRDLLGKPGTMAFLTKVSGAILTFDVDTVKGDAINDTSFPQSDNPRVRLWDHAGPAAVPVSPDYVDLEDGLQVRFQAGDRYESGDYWQIPARSVEGTIEWDKDADGKYEFMQRFGIRHHYACLAVLRPAGNSKLEATDTRHTFAALTDPALFYVGGDGQEARPGRELPMPLEACAANGPVPVAGAWVRFAITKGGGKLAGTGNAGTDWLGIDGTSIRVRTGPGGAAACRWTPDSEGWENDDSPIWSQQVEATLLDADCKAAIAVPPVHFNASLSVADDVAIVNNNCPRLGNSETVQDAVDKICSERALYYVGGDGQEADPGEALPWPLEAGVASGPMAVRNAVVQFRVESGEGVLKAHDCAEETSIDPHHDKKTIYLRTNDRGIAGCTLTLDDKTESQRVCATLVDNNNPRDLPVYFNAKLERGSCCHYTVGRGESLAEVIKNLASKKRGDICICLPPGRYPVEKPIGVRGEINLKITGCSPGTVIEFAKGASWKLDGLASFVLKDMAIRFSGAETPLMVGNCGDVRIDSCDITGFTGSGGALLDFKSCGRVSLDGDSIKASRRDTALFLEMYRQVMSLDTWKAKLYDLPDLEKLSLTLSSLLDYDDGEFDKGLASIVDMLTPIKREEVYQLIYGSLESRYASLVKALGSQKRDEYKELLTLFDAFIQEYGKAWKEQDREGAFKKSLLPILKEVRKLYESGDFYGLGIAAGFRGGPAHAEVKDCDISGHVFMRAQDDISLYSCRIEGFAGEQPLLKADKCGRIIMEDNRIKAERRDTTVFRGICNRVLSLASDPKFTPDLNKKLVQFSDSVSSLYCSGDNAAFSDRECLVMLKTLKNFQSHDNASDIYKFIAESYTTQLDSARQEATNNGLIDRYKNLFDILSVVINDIESVAFAKFDKAQVDKLMDAIMDARMLCLFGDFYGPGVALQFSDGDADACIKDNGMYGYVRLYGETGIDEAMQGVNAKRVHAVFGDFKVRLPGLKKGALYVHRNRLTGITTMDLESLGKIKSIFRNMSIADNVFESGALQLIGYDVKLSSNSFSVDKKNTGWIMDNTIVYMANTASDDLKITEAGVSKPQADMAKMNIKVSLQ